MNTEKWCPKMQMLMSGGCVDCDCESPSDPAGYTDRENELRRVLNKMLIYCDHTSHCCNINGHPNPDNGCICYIGEARKAMAL